MQLNSKKLKVFWCAHSENRNHPADRRRFGWFINRSNLIEVKNIEESDVVYFSIASDLSLIKWQLENRTLIGAEEKKFIFDFCDSLLSMSNIQSYLRAILYSFTKYKYSIFSLKNTILACLRLCDGIVVSSYEQKEIIKKINHNVHVIPDSFTDEFNFKNNQYKSREINLLWEGLSSGNKNCFEHCAQIAQLVSNKSKRPVKVTFVTDLDYYLISNKYFKTSTDKILNKIFSRFTVSYSLKKWTIENLNNAISRSLVAIIPIGNNKIMRSKPENKMILFMTAGIPVISSDTLAYNRVANLAEINCTAKDNDQFSNLICDLLDEDLSRTHIRKGKEFVLATRSKEVLLKKWWNLINSIS